MTWDTTPKSWGAEQASSIVFGNGVIDDLVTGMGDFLPSHRMSKRMASAALGCVGWLTDEEVVAGYVLTCQSVPLGDGVAVDYDA